MEEDVTNTGSEIVEFNYPVPWMKFTLTYDGPLVSSAKVHRTEEKQAIRRHFHPQLEELLKVHPAMESRRRGYEEALREAELNLPLTERKASMTVTPINDYRFAALFAGRLGLTCRLDILFLRRSKPGGIIHAGGDVDNRLLTLFDALKAPSKPEDLGSIKVPIPEPCYCLLEDDSQISGFSVRTDQLLHPMNNSTADVRLAIDVTIEVREMSRANFSMLGP